MPAQGLDTLPAPAFAAGTAQQAPPLEPSSVARWVLRPLLAPRCPVSQQH